MWYVYTVEYYLAIKKKKILLFSGKWLELEIIILNEISQTQGGFTHFLSVAECNVSFFKDMKIDEAIKSHFFH
jgi:hypothetical protein